MLVIVIDAVSPIALCMDPERMTGLSLELKFKCLISGQCCVLCIISCAFGNSHNGVREKRRHSIAVI